MAKSPQFKEPGTTGGAATEPTYAELKAQVAALLLERETRVITLDEAREEMRVTSEYVIATFEESQEQHFALCVAMVNQLAPADPQNPPDDCPILAWRIGQVLEGMLGSTADARQARNFLLGEPT